MSRRTIILTIILVVNTIFAYLYFNAYPKLIKFIAPKFELYTVDGKKIRNTDYEYTEQSLLYKYLDKDDIVLQLGGNIGTSCIFADKLLDKKIEQICVEPNKDIIHVLEKNKKLNNASFNVVNAIISNKQCSYSKNELDHDNLKIMVNYTHDSNSSNNDSKIDCIDYQELEKMINARINVLFFDCEGCTCDFLEMYENILPEIKTIFVEKDMPQICNYQERVEPILRKHNFLLKNDQFHQVWVKGVAN